MSADRRRVHVEPPSGAGTVVALPQPRSRRSGWGRQAIGGLRPVLRAVLLALEAAERRVAGLLLRLGRPVRVHPFAGFGTVDRVLLGGRVLVGAPPRPRSGPASRWAVLRANLLPFLSVEVPRAQVRVTLDGCELVVQADSEGYVRALVEHLRLPPGRHRVTLVPVRPAGEPAFGTVHVADPAADHRFPDGPLVLTDWGPGADGLLRISARAHKLSTLRRLARVLPDSRFVLIGDSGSSPRRDRTTGMTSPSRGSHRYPGSVASP